MKVAAAIGIILGSLAGCGGASWTSADDKAALNIAKGQTYIQRACDDASVCTAEVVRSLAFADLCAAESMLVRHDGLDAGSECKP